MRVLFIVLPILAAARNKPTVVVTGATGRSGSLFYNRLKKDGNFNVRALVRNATKAKSILGCSVCDETEGVFVGDLTIPSSLTRIMKGADSLAIFTSSAPRCSGLIPLGPFGNCSYPKGGEPKAIDFLGTKAQIAAFASAGGNINSKQILYMSTMGTTTPDNFLDKVAHGYVSFYHLQAEMLVMGSGIPFTIVKACGLSDGKGGKKLTVGHDDKTLSYIHTISRDDVARVLVEAVRKPAAAAGLRFDMCSDWFGRPSADIVNDVFKPARYPWDTRSFGDSSAFV